MIHIRDLTKTYNDLRQGKRIALAGVSLDAHPGQIFGLLGPNGAGKTTLLRILATILQPDGGSASVNRFDVLTQPAQVRRQLGFVSNNTATYERMTAYEIVEYFGKLHDLDAHDLEHHIESLFTRLQMHDIRDTLCGTMSTGMRQKVSIARALVHDPPVIIFDEATVGLDVLVGRALLEIIADLRDQGKCVILSTHILREAEKLCDRLAILYDGYVLAEGSQEGLLHQHQVEDLETLFFSLIDRHTARGRNSGNFAAALGLET
jgi:sodium transport system ATP-binding protein